MCELDTGDYSSVFSDTPRRARKEHLCDSCCATITKGERYFVHFSVFDGNAISEKCCASCKADREAFAAAPGHIDTNPGAFIWLLGDCVDYGDDDVVGESARWRAMLDRINAGRRAHSEARRAAAMAAIGGAL